MGDTGFTAKIKIKRKMLPSSPIHVKIQATPENKMEGGSAAAESRAMFPSAPTIRAPKTISPKKGSYK